MPPKGTNKGTISQPSLFFFGHHGMYAIVPCSTNMVSVWVIFGGRFHFYFILILRAYFLNKTITISFALVGYEMVRRIVGYLSFHIQRALVELLNRHDFLLANCEFGHSTLLNKWLRRLHINCLFVCPTCTFYPALKAFRSSASSATAIKTTQAVFHVITFRMFRTLVPETEVTLRVLSWRRAPVWKRNHKKKNVKGAQSRYFELFWPHKKLPLNGRKPENNSLIR